MSRTITVDIINQGTIDCQNTTTISGFRIKRTAVSSNYSILSTDNMIGVDTS